MSGPAPIRDAAGSPSWLTPNQPLFTVKPGWNGVVATAEGAIPAGVIDPPAQWLFEIVTPLCGVMLLAILGYRAAKARSLNWAFLFTLCAASTWWMETFGDWGQQLYYSPNFIHYSWHLPFTMPHNPYFMPAAYAFYWWIQAVLALTLARSLSKRWGWSIGKGIILIAVPLSFIWDFFVEGAATYMGWWTYEPAIGPYIDMGRGNMPLLWPMILMFIWPNLIAWLAHESETTGLNLMERLGGLARFTRPSSLPDNSGLYEPTIAPWKFQLVRAAIWLLGFQLSFFLINVLPLVSVWYFLGHPTPYAQCHPYGCH